MKTMPHRSSAFGEDHPLSDVPNLFSEKSFTLREREIIQGLSNDQNVKMIAQTLHLSTFTVQDHIKNIKYKMEVHTPGGIVAKAFREKLIQ